jgi:hypothetical protein
MAIRGEIVVECGTPTCHAEIVFPADRFINPAKTLATLRVTAGWRTYLGKDICPQCLEEQGPKRWS